jgi:phage-related protein
MRPADKPLVWLRGEVKTPPFSSAGRLEAGFLLRRLQQGEVLSLPQSRPMPEIGPQCHELRINDGRHAWRVIYHVAGDAIVVLDIFAKQTQSTPQNTIAACRNRLRAFQRAATGEE